MTIDKKSPEEEGDGDNNAEQFELVSWEDSKGAVVIQIRFSDVLNKLPIFDKILGEVVIPPFESIVNNEQWYWWMVSGTTKRNDGETIEEFPVKGQKENESKSLLSRLTVVPDKNETSEKVDKNYKVPCVYVKATFSNPTNNGSNISK